MVILWGKLRAPQWVRRELFDFPPMPLVKMKLMEKIGMMGIFASDPKMPS